MFSTHSVNVLWFVVFLFFASVYLINVQIYLNLSSWKSSRALLPFDSSDRLKLFYRSVLDHCQVETHHFLPSVWLKGIYSCNFKHLHLIDEIEYYSLLWSICNTKSSDFPIISLIPDTQHFSRFNRRHDDDELVGSNRIRIFLFFFVSSGQHILSQILESLYPFTNFKRISFLIDFSNGLLYVRRSYKPVLLQKHSLPIHFIHHKQQPLPNLRVAINHFPDKTHTP